MNYDFDETVRLEDDLYNYVNGKWISKAKIPADKPTTGGFINLQDGVEKTLLKDFKKYSQKLTKDELFNRALNLYNKVMNEDERIKGKSYLLDKANYLDNIKDNTSFNEAVYYLYDNNYPLPFSMGVSEDMKDATKHALCLMGPHTILPDTSMYNTPNKEQLLNVYKEMALTILNKLEIPNALDLLNKTLEFDDKLSKIVKSSEEWADYIKAYNPYSINDLINYFDFNFKSLVVSRYGILPDTVIVYEPRFIENYKDGYDTNLSKMFFNDAIEPSGGQWQKIAISRAVYSAAQVLVLDEPTAALDPKSEVKMFDTFKKISELKSTIIISHRMYITKLADKIILLENGNLIEEGSFEELIKLKKEFYSMYKIQSDSYSMSVE